MFYHTIRTIGMLAIQRRHMSVIASQIADYLLHCSFNSLFMLVTKKTPTNFHGMKSGDFTSHYISYRIVYSILIGAGHIYICMYVCIYICIYIYIHIYVCLRMHVAMYTRLYACILYVLILCMLILIFYRWFLGQRWPNKEVQTIKRHPDYLHA